MFYWPKIKIKETFTYIAFGFTEANETVPAQTGCQDFGSRYS